MPLYQYRDVQTGRLVELFRPVAGRDQVPAGLRRITVPERVGVQGTSSSPIDPGDADYQVPRAFRQVEEKMSAREIVRESGYTVDEIKRVWSM